MPVNPNITEILTSYRMGVFSFLRKDKQESVSVEAEFQTRAEGESKAVRSRRKRKQGTEGNEPVDPVLPEKKRARRRLIGAVALVLAAVIGLPMILDSEPKPLAEDIAIQIPSKDKPPAPQPSRERDASAPAPKEPAVSAALDKGEEIVNLPEPAAPRAAQEPKPATVPNVQAKAEAPAAPQPEKKPVARAEPQEAARSDDSARARSILEGRQESAAEKSRTALEKKPSRFIVQVAALASQDKVNELQGRLKGAGIKSQSQKVPTPAGERIRVRVGPFASKEEAEKMRARLARMGLSGTLIPA